MKELLLSSAMTSGSEHRLVPFRYVFIMESSMYVPRLESVSRFAPNGSIRSQSSGESEMMCSMRFLSSREGRVRRLKQRCFPSNTTFRVPGFQTPLRLRPVGMVSGLLRNLGCALGVKH